jgi:hypothetical protein
MLKLHNQTIKAKVKIKFALEQATKAQRGGRGITTLSLTLLLDGGRWSTPRPDRFTPGKDPVPIVRRVGGPQCRSGWKISPPTGIRFPDRPARSESPYRLSYPGSLVTNPCITKSNKRNSSLLVCYAVPSDIQLPVFRRNVVILFRATVLGLRSSRP